MLRLWVLPFSFISWFCFCLFGFHPSVHAMLLLSLTGIDFINDRLLHQENFLPTDTAPQAQSSTEDDEDDFFFKETQL